MKTRLKHKLFILIVMSDFCGTISAQKVYKYNSPGSDCYSEIIFEEKALNPKGVIVVDVKGNDLVSFSQSNVYIKSGIFKDYNFLYYNTLNQGNSSPLACSHVVINTISEVYRVFKSAFYLLVDQQEHNLIIKRATEEAVPFNIIYNSDTDINKLISSLNEATKNQTYRIPFHSLENNDQEYEARMKNYKRNFDIGVYLTPMILTSSRIGLSKGVITMYGLSFAKNIGTQFSIRANVGGSFKKPDQSSIQSGIQAKMQEAIRNGDDSVYIDQTLSGHVIFGGDITARYYFEKSKKFRPYAALGIGSYKVTSISGRIQDTIDISDIDPNDPSSMQGLMGGGGASTGSVPEGMENSMKDYFVPQLEFGFEHRLAPAAKFNLSLPIRYYMSRSGDNQLNTVTFGLNMGLSFTINPGKYPRRLKVKRE